MAARPGVVDGYNRLVASGVLRHVVALPAEGPSGVALGDAYWSGALKHVRDFDVSLLIFHYYHAPSFPDPRPFVARFRRLANAPFVVSTLGDAFMNGFLNRPNVPRSFLQAASQSDLVTLTSMGALADYVARRTPAPIVLMPNAACQVRFGATAANRAVEPSREFDVVFIGSRNAPRNPLRPYWHAARRRAQLVNQLGRRFGSRFAVFGRGWKGFVGVKGPIPFGSQVSAARRGRVVVGGVPFSRERYYTSNRPFMQMTAGVPFVDARVDGVDTLLTPDRDWFLADDAAIVDVVERLLERSDSELEQVGASGASRVLRTHMEHHRTAAIAENVARLRMRRTGGSRVQPHLPFFTPETDLEREHEHATRNWS